MTSEPILSSLSVSTPEVILAIGLQGRNAEAEKIVRADLPPAEAAANVTQLKQLLSRKDKDARAEPGKMPIAAAGRSD